MKKSIEEMTIQAGLNYHINVDVYYEWDKGGISLEMMKRLCNMVENTNTDQS